MKAEANALAQLFGLGEPVSMREAARGAMGAVWRLETTSGVFAAKELFWFEPGEASVQTEITFRTACAAAGVNSPKSLASPSGSYVVRPGEARGASAPPPVGTEDDGWWRLYEWVDGDVPDHGEVDVTCWLAAQMAAIHTLDWRGGGADPVPWYHRVDADWSALAEAAKRARAEWAEALERVQPRLVELTSLVNSAPVGDQVWCHRDLKNTNVLRLRSHPAVAEGNWLVDWDNAGPLAPRRELGALLMDQLDAPDNLRKIVGAYRAAGGPAEIDDPAGFATGLAVSLNFLHGQANAAMDTGLADAHRQYADRQIIGLIASLPSPEVLEKAAEALQR
ncbi:phosphotransferase enzyme family protein [Kribbella catacumbae]|uniref:phosphotransferase enzyme family protein n=1 Tax=Kribbella catacumbae TaxID=460086 RepID=UPI0003714BED|nr:phosphotransferase [Kribbella catacumbae]